MGSPLIKRPAPEPAHKTKAVYMFAENKTEEISEAEENYPDETSKEIMEGIKKEKKEEAKPAGEEKPKVEPKKEQPQEKEDAGDEDEDKEEEKEKTEKKGRTPRLMPIFKHKIALSRLEKSLKESHGAEKAKLEGQVKELQDKLGESKPDEKADIFKKFAEKHGMDAEMLKEFADLMVSLKVSTPAVSDELKEKIEKGETAFTKISSKEEQDKEDAEFDKEYADDKIGIIPLLKELNVPEDKHAEVRKALYDLAFTEEYSKVALKTIFLGDDAFEQYRLGRKKTAEDSNGGARTENAGEEKDWKDMSISEFEKDSESRAAKEPKFKIRRRI